MSTVYNGIDVSRWQGTINWASVKAAGNQFAMIRAGYCNTAGGMVKDPQFAANMANAAAAGVDVGVYVYNYATTTAAAAAAARGTLELIKGYTLTYPVAFDIEDAVNVSLTKAQNTAIAKAFLSVIVAAGYCPLLYTYKAFAETELNMSELAEYDFWLAHVTSKTNYTGAYTMWQYSWTGSVKGISGDVDQNYCYKDYPTYIRENGLNGFAVPGGDESSGEEDGGESAGEENTGADTGDTGSGAGVPNEPGDIAYNVVKNDTLYHIAQRHSIPLRVLIQANPQIKNPDLIYPGDVVHIPQTPKTRK